MLGNLAVLASEVCRSARITTTRQSLDCVRRSETRATITAARHGASGKKAPRSESALGRGAWHWSEETTSLAPLLLEFAVR